MVRHTQRRIAFALMPVILSGSAFQAQARSGIAEASAATGTGSLAQLAQGNTASVPRSSMPTAAEQFAGLSYPSSEPPSVLFDSPKLLTDYAARYKADLEAILSRSDIDAPTRSSILAQLVIVAMTQKDWPAALARIAPLREAQTAPASRYTASIDREIIARHMQSGRPLGAIARETLKGMPWSIVDEDLRERVTGLEKTTEADHRHQIKTQLDPQAKQRNGRLTAAMLGRLLLRRYEVDHLLPRKAALLAEFYAYIDANYVEKPDIWPARSLDIAGRRGLHPVTIAVWDTGIDMNVYKKQAWRNPRERKNGRDDDGNGFVDDLHGLSYDIGYVRSAEPLSSVAELQTPLAELPRLRENYTKMDFGIPSPEARRFARAWAAMTPERKEIINRDLGLYSGYYHGTLMSGIAIAGNPAARLMDVRYDFGGSTRAVEPITEEVAERFAAAVRDTISYFKRHKVRVASISWGISLSEVRESLESVESDPERRKSRAAAIHERMRAAFETEMRNAPDVLFVTSVGNGGDDVDKERIFPGIFNLPNQISVGATDQAGARLPWSNFGKHVDLFATGWRLPSRLPGGAWTREGAATSQATAYVSNNVGKLLALYPRLKPAEVKRLVTETCDKTAEEGVCLLNLRAAAKSAALELPPEPDRLRRNGGQAAPLRRSSS